MRNIARSCNLLEQTLPKPALRPSVVTIVDRGRRAVFRRHVAPAASGLENVQDATDDTTIIDARFTGLAARQMWINRGPRFVDSQNRRVIKTSRLDEPNQKVNHQTKQ